MYTEVREFFQDILRRLPGAAVVVLTGQGKHFCAGNDLAEFPSPSPGNAAERMENVRNTFWAIRECPIPVVGAVNGAALGTGLCIAASCDVVVAADGARFGLPEVNVGMMGGAKHASRLSKFGGVLEVVSHSELLDTAHQVARLMSRHSPVTLKFAKRSLNEIEYRSLRDGYTYEQGLSGELSAYRDAKEAVNAALEKRSPIYSGD
ncbi:enoyl-CoA hydratase-related protein [Amycolatopsis pithecellobii]|uniref:enoyl-CoA hydratase-related protein n=1 Tax=Amycolatopsis pithecellobii TaxID=664692 RepID=UPI001AA05171|nr:enoyl-CoA hydratase-related protein [Amycolatopsis pithecellobii]